MSDVPIGFRLSYNTNNWLNTFEPENIKDWKSLIKELKQQNTSQAKIIKDLVLEIERMRAELARIINTKADA
jgi:hypothetical protein